MEGEIHNFIVVWAIFLASLCYSHTIAKFFPKGKSRFLAIIPIVCLFYILPLYLTSISLCGITSFFIIGLATFKLILFSFDKGPLSSTPPLPLSTFIPLACLPIKFQKYSTSDNVETTKRATNSTFNLVTKIAFIAILIRVYSYKDNLHPKIILFCYCLHIYFMLEIILNIVSFAVRWVSRVQLESPINDPHLASSLQDFWGKRWNLMTMGHGSFEDQSKATFSMTDEDHTLANAVRFTLNQDLRVTFCGYSIPLPSDARVNIRVQTTGDPAREVLNDSCQDLTLICENIRDTFDKAILKFKTEESLSSMDIKK